MVHFLLRLSTLSGPFTVFNPEITWRSDETFTLWDDVRLGNCNRGVVRSAVLVVNCLVGAVGLADPRISLPASLECPAVHVVSVSHGHGLAQRLHVLAVLG